MITIFNGKERRLGQGRQARVFAQIDVGMRDYLHLLRGAKLAVLLAIALHADENGWAWPSYEALQRETGYSKNAIINALAELCHLEIQGRRVLLRYQPIGDGGRFASNRYLIFPSPEEVAQYEGTGVAHLGYASRSQTVTQFLGDGSPSPTFPCTKKWVTNNNHDQTITMGEEEEEEEGGKEKKIARTLEENGVFPENAARIGQRMAQAGISPEDALEILLNTLQSLDSNLPDEQAMARAVHRLEQGIWDAGKRVRTARRRAHYATAESFQGEDHGPATSDDPAASLWQAVLDKLQLEMTRATFNTWLRPTRLVACEDGVFVIGAANEYARDWLEGRLRPVVERVLARVVGQSVSVQFVVAG